MRENGTASEHGTGLRSRLVESGVALVAEGGVHALTLREIARRAGVSHGAPRRYFPTHVALLSAIARRGFDDLADRVAGNIGDSFGGNPRDQLVALGRSYLDFALGNRGMFELMFRHDLLKSDHLGLRETSLPLFATLTELVSRAQPATGTPPRIVAGALWANLHGVAQLWGAGSLQLATGTDDVEPLLRATLEAHLGPEAR
ncbi:TetR/AcrR family transcriptional regulator [Streptomyces sp. NPDC059176]|uniref:TetR/AcrR family transcriptional regulator n=1 Tax=unclassified Streptomyces TaxID=2593676 RepID=UPI0036739B78